MERQGKIEFACGRTESLKSIYQVLSSLVAEMFMPLSFSAGLSAVVVRGRVGTIRELMCKRNDRIYTRSEWELHIGTEIASRLPMGLTFS